MENTGNRDKCQSREGMEGVGEGGLPGWGLGGAASESLGVIPLSLCLNMSLGFTAR